MEFVTQQAIASLQESIALVDEIVAERRKQKKSESRFLAVSRELREIEKFLEAIC